MTKAVIRRWRAAFGDLHAADDQRPDDRLRDGDIKAAMSPAYTLADHEPERIGASMAAMVRHRNAG